MTTARSPELSLQHLLGATYNPKQLQFILAPEFETCWVGGMGAGKSYAACCAVIRHMALFPGAKVLIARSTEEELYRNPKPLFFEIVKAKKLEGYFTRPKVWDYRERTNYLRMVNGSEATFGSLYSTAGEAAIDRYKNVEYSMEFIDQLEQIDFQMYQLLLQRCRYSAAPPESRRVLTVAQDEGDNWIRRRFLTYEQPHGIPTDPLAQRRLIRGGSLENPHLDAGARAQLLSLPLSVQEMWVHATMAAGANRLIPELRVVDPIEPPPHWPVWVGVDPARSTGITSAEWLTCNPDKETYKGVPPNAPCFFREYWAAGRDAEVHAQAILKASYPRRVSSYVMDRTAWNSTIKSSKTGSLTVADLYVGAGLGVSPSVGDAWVRVGLFTSAYKRGLLVTSNCENLIRQAPDYRIKDQEVQSGPGTSVIKNKQRFHSIDSGGYALGVLPSRVAPLDMFGLQPQFNIQTTDEASVAHWKGVLSSLPLVNRQRPSQVTAAFDEQEFHSDESEKEIDADMRPEENLAW